MLRAFYRQFRAAGLTAPQALAAARAAVRVAVAPIGNDFANWVRLFRTRTPAQLADLAATFANIPE